MAGNWTDTSDPADLFAVVYDHWQQIADVNLIDEWRDQHFDEILAGVRRDSRSR